uniref:Uncharacterized protein n=1 Tax=Caenorhabditis japonica TaxID=281687 RepID=A0A8R1I1T4_CAEJA
MNLPEIFQQPLPEYPITRYADPVKKNQNLIKEFKTVQGVVGFSLAGKQEAHGDCLVFAQDYLGKHFQKYPKPAPDARFIVPKTAVTVSVAMENFIMGNSCQEFFPDPKYSTEKKTDSYFSYQKFSKHVQATYYNENGVPYLAGLCYYPQLVSTSGRTCNQDGNALDRALERGEHFPAVDRTKTVAYVEKKRFGRFCKSSGGRVTVEVTGSGAKHVVWYGRGAVKYVDCSECNLENCCYQFMESPSHSPSKPTLTNKAGKKEEKIKKEVGELKEENAEFEEEKDFDFGDDITIA